MGGDGLTRLHPGLHAHLLLSEGERKVAEVLPVRAGSDRQSGVLVADVRFRDEGEGHSARLVGGTPSGEPISVFEECCLVLASKDDEVVRPVVPCPKLVRVLGCEVTGGVNCLCCLQTGRQIVANNDVQVLILSDCVGVGWGLALMVGHGDKRYGTDRGAVKRLLSWSYGGRRTRTVERGSLVAFGGNSMWLFRNAGCVLPRIERIDRNHFIIWHLTALVEFRKPFRLERRRLAGCLAVRTQPGFHWTPFVPRRQR